MKTLKDHVLLFDEQWPLCTAYSQTFVKRGMLDENGRQAISFAASLILLLFIDFGNLFSLTNPFIYATGGMLVVAAMFTEHLRRMKRLKRPLFASISWVIHRIIVLTLILSGL